MNFELTENQKQILSLIRDFCKKEIKNINLEELAEKAAVARSVEEIRAIQPLDFIKKLHAAGLRQLSVPEKYGGGGITDWLTLTLAAEEAGYSGGSMGRLVSLPWKHTSDMALKATPEQQDWFFEQFMKNETFFVCAATSEPEGMTDILLPYDDPGAALRTYAYKDGNEWVINGNKMFSSGAAIADMILVGARTDKNGPVSKSMSRFWVKKDTPGMTMEINRMMMADITGNAQIHLDNVRVPEHHLVGELNDSWAMFDVRLANKMFHFAVNLGIYRKLLEDLVDYAKNRVCGGKPLAQHPNISMLLGEAAINLESARAFFYKAAWESDQQEKEGPLAVNPFWGKACFFVYKKVALRFSEIGTEVYGGIAGSIDLPFNRFVRNSFLIYPGGGTAVENAIKCAKHLYAI